MEYSRIAVAPSTSALGAEISGVDLSRPPERDIAAEIRSAFRDHQVLFFRDQNLTPTELVAAAGLFGPIGIYPFAAPIAEHPQVIPVIKEEHQKTNFGGLWHSDTPYLARPALGSALYALEVPKVGGDTVWADCYRAWETLSDGLRQMLESLRAVHSAAKNKGRLRGHYEAATDVAEADHPVARTHPETGRISLYVSPAHTTRFAGWSEEESAPLLDYLFHHMTREENTCRFRWSKGTLAVWDNRCTLHYPLNDYHGHRRIMHRVTIEGETPV